MVQQNKPTQSKDKEPNKSSREIEAEISETRSAISDDIRTLSDKLSPAHLKDEAKQAVANAASATVDKAVEVKDAVVEKAAEVKDTVVEKAVELKDEAAEKLSRAKDAAIETIEYVEEQAQEIGTATWRFTKANAVPLTLIGVGAGWMIANSRRSMAEDRYDRDRALPPGVEPEEYEWSDRSVAVRPGLAGTQRTPPRARAQAPRGNPPGAARRLGAQAGDKARGIVRDAGESVRRAEHTIADRASQGAEYVREGLTRAREASANFVEENPLVVALASLAAGVGVGLLLPSTERETRLMRPARRKFDELIGDVRDAAGEVSKAAKDTASETVQAMT